MSVIIYQYFSIILKKSSLMFIFADAQGMKTSHGHTKTINKAHLWAF